MTAFPQATRLFAPGLSAPGTLPPHHDYILSGYIVIVSGFLPPKADLGNVKYIAAFSQ